MFFVTFEYMTTGSILIGIALLILVGLFLVRPLLQATQREQKRLSHRQALLAEKDAILDQIRDLDFDRDTGKMPDEIHRRQREQLMESAAAILQQLEPLDGSPPTSIIEESGVDAAIEAAVARVRQGAPKQQARPTRSSKASGFCPNCGKPFDGGDNFCVSCGRKL
jgi:hypothetical protein